MRKKKERGGQEKEGWGIEGGWGEGGGVEGGRVRHCWCLSDWRRWESFVTPHLSPLVTLGMHAVLTSGGGHNRAAIRGLTRENCKHKKIDADKSQMAGAFFASCEGYKVFLCFKGEDNALSRLKALQGKYTEI